MRMLFAALISVVFFLHIQSSSRCIAAGKSGVFNDLFNVKPKVKAGTSQPFQDDSHTIPQFQCDKIESETIDGIVKRGSQIKTHLQKIKSFIEKNADENSKPALKEFYDSVLLVITSVTPQMKKAIDRWNNYCILLKTAYSEFLNKIRSKPKQIAKGADVVESYEVLLNEAGAPLFEMNNFLSLLLQEFVSLAENSNALNKADSIGKTDKKALLEDLKNVALQFTEDDKESMDHLEHDLQIALSAELPNPKTFGEFLDVALFANLEI